MANINTSLIQQLENNEALLLMYLTDELPADDRSEVEQLLSSDASMRAELERTRLAYEKSMGWLSRLDGDRSALPAENHAIRQAMRAMKQWQVDRLIRQPLQLPVASKQIPAWAYPLGSIAALLIGTIAWWGFSGQFRGGNISSGGTSTVAENTPPESPDGNGAAGGSAGGPASGIASDNPSSSDAKNNRGNTPLSPEDLATVARLDDSLRSDTLHSSGAVGESARILSDAESQASSLVARSDGANVTSSIFFTEANQ